MKNIVGVRFKKPGKIYFFDPGNLKINLKDKVIVDTSQGEEIGEVAISNRKIPDEKVVEPLKKVTRIATYKDIKHDEENKAKEIEAFKVCEDKIKEHNLEMKLIDVEYKFDNSKILFYFSANGRIDFRDLVKDLAAIYKTRIELRQIGVRDKAKEIGGLGPCGRMLCCNSFLTDLNSVTINMAKNQLLALNPTKINGSCGRLLCCLAYEDVVYTKLRENLPDIGDTYKDKKVAGKVINIDILKQKIYVEDSQNNVHEIEVSNGNH
jgi:cell fate regulator YaaT (PSP1 superfamily)